MRDSTKKNIESTLALVKENLGYKEIALRMNRSEGTIRAWLAPYKLFGDSKEKLRENQKKATFKLKEKFANLRRDSYELARENAAKDLQNPLLRDFINLYIGEGSKRRETVISIINSDPKIIFLSLSLIKKYFLQKDKKINLEIRYYKENGNERELLDYWKKLLNNDESISFKTYLQPTVKSIGHNNSNNFGLVRVEVYDTYARQKLNAYMDYLKKEWVKEFEMVFNTKVDTTITEVVAKKIDNSINLLKKPTKKVVSYPHLLALKEMIVEKGYSQVARELNCSPKAIRNHIAKHDKESLKVERTRVNYPDLEKLISMVKEKGFVQVGKDLGCSDNAIRKHLKKNKIDIESIK